MDFGLWTLDYDLILYFGSPKFQNPKSKEVQSTDFVNSTHCVPIWSLYFKAASHTAAAAIVFLSDPCGLMCYHLDGRPMNKYRVWEACNALQISWVGAKSSDSAKTIKEEKTSLGTCLKMISEVLQIIHWFWLLKSSPREIDRIVSFSFWYFSPWIIISVLW